jgi:hypothetical protein
VRHRASRLQAVVAALLLALGAIGVAASVASSPSSASAPAAAASARAHTRHEAFAARSSALPSSKAGSHAAGPHLDLTASLPALVAGALLLLGWVVAGRTRPPLPRRIGAPSAARAPPAFV